MDFVLSSPFYYWVGTLAVEDLSKLNAVLQEEITRLREDLEVSGKQIADFEERNIQLNTARDEAITKKLSAQEELNYCKFNSF